VEFFPDEKHHKDKGSFGRLQVVRTGQDWTIFPSFRVCAVLKISTATTHSSNRTHRTAGLSNFRSAGTARFHQTLGTNINSSAGKPLEGNPFFLYPSLDSLPIPSGEPRCKDDTYVLCRSHASRAGIDCDVGIPPFQCSATPSSTEPGDWTFSWV
jgi:hypothetical protein